MRVDIVERHGADKLIYGVLYGYAMTDGEPIEIRIKTDQQTLLKIEFTLKLGFDPKRALIFRKDNGERLV